MPIRVSLTALALIAALFVADAWSASSESGAPGMQSTGEAGVRDVSSAAARGHRLVDKPR